MKPCAFGILVGGSVGAVCRPVFLSPFGFQVPGEREFSTAGLIAVVFTSSAIGLVIGLIASWIAVSFAWPGLGIGLGGTVGAILAWIARFTTFLCLCMSTNTAQAWYLGSSRNNPVRPVTTLEFLLWLALVAASGAVPAVVGGLAANWRRCRTANSKPATTPDHGGG